MADQRRDLDFYPTPPDSGLALARWIQANVPEATRRGVWLDPAAGYGALIEALGYEGVLERATWLAYELQSQFRDQLDRIATTRTVDSLAVDWPAAHVAANPPFGMLDEFVARIVDHVAAHGVWAFVLTRLQWLDDRPLSVERYRRCRPANILRMPWRNRFTGRSPSCTHCWLVYAPRLFRAERTQTEWLERPVLSAEHELVRRHHEMTSTYEDAA